ncbi:hypothetical protein [Pontibacter ruber]|uniref:Uncharacterized protein n=1 Tax=Pontibacter ruber TaxID=1343895 RepID=A0ABW5CU06_9BACT|nr:hypothetical protein [Pontibacter ruber]
MKILVLLSASLFGFGFAVQSTVGVAEQPVRAAEKVVVVEPIEAPVIDVLLDTLEITAEAPASIAKAEAPDTGVLLDTVEITAVAPSALAANVR